MATRKKPTPPADAWEMWGDDARYERNRVTGDFRLNTSPWAQELARQEAQARRASASLRRAPATRPLPAEKPAATPAPKRAPRPKALADPLRKTPVRELTDAQLRRDWENHPPERRRGVLEREMARRHAKAEKAAQPPKPKPVKRATPAAKAQPPKPAKRAKSAAKPQRELWRLTLKELQAERQKIKDRRLAILADIDRLLVQRRATNDRKTVTHLNAQIKKKEREFHATDDDKQRIDYELEHHPDAYRSVMF